MWHVRALSSDDKKSKRHCEVIHWTQNLDKSREMIGKSRTLLMRTLLPVDVPDLSVTSQPKCELFR